ncbi:MAG: TetR/AcrR family transcriptional regulator [Spirochaetaceae bacterium]|nr:TetR/AcrR family transcriptional regulator [Spirochaetaceae bacterium]
MMSKSKASVERTTPSTRERILETATRIIVERGVGGLRIRELAHEVGIREGSIYNHFAGRNEIIEAIFRQADARMSPFGALLDLETTPKDQLDLTRKEIRSTGLAGFLADSAEYVVQEFAKYPDALCLIRAIISARFHDESARRAYEEVFRKDMSRAILAVCHIAFEQGLLKQSIRPQALADLMAAAFEYAIGDSFAPDGFERFKATLRNLFGVIGAMASR